VSLALTLLSLWGVQTPTCTELTGNDVQQADRCRFHSKVWQHMCALTRASQTATPQRSAHHPFHQAPAQAVKPPPESVQLAYGPPRLEIGRARLEGATYVFGLAKTSLLLLFFWLTLSIKVVVSAENILVGLFR